MVVEQHGPVLAHEGEHLVLEPEEVQVVVPGGRGVAERLPECPEEPAAHLPGRRHDERADRRAADDGELRGLHEDVQRPARPHVAAQDAGEDDHEAEECEHAGPSTEYRRSGPRT